MNGAPSTRPLPGFRFEVQGIAAGDSLPRMDIAAMVGFAGAGPLHLPVLVENDDEFEMIYGRDLTLATTPAGVVRYAHLAPAVRDFFRQGGRRCWVVRVAGAHAVTSQFPLPGVMRSEAGVLGPVFAPARSPGSGFDRTRIATALRSRSVEVVHAADLLQGRVTLRAVGSQALRVGDTLRFSFRSLGLEAVGVIDGLGPASPGLPAARVDATEARFATFTWFAWPAVLSPPTPAGVATAFVSPASVRVGTVVPIANPDDSTSAPEFLWPVRLEDRNVTVALTFPDRAATTIGTSIRLDFGDQTLLLRVDTVEGAVEVGSPPTTIASATGEARWHLRTAPGSLPDSPPTAEVLTFELRSRTSNAAGERLSDLAFHDAHTRCWSRLPSDAQYYGEADPADAVRAADAEAFEDLWVEAGDPRFPLAGTLDSTTLPVLMRALPDQWLGPVGTEVDPLVRNGLETFSASLFLDPDLVEPTIFRLQEEADFLRFHSSRPRSLLGIHAILGIEEAALIAVPDAVHPGWSAAVAPAEPQGSPPPPASPPWGDFLRCGIQTLTAPELNLLEGPDAEGTCRLAWIHTDPSAEAIELFESSLASLADASAIYRGPGSELTLFGRTHGTRYFVARSLAGSNVGAWSQVVEAVPPLANRWQVAPWDDARRNQLLALQRAILRLCAARGDLFGVLALPEDWREAEALEHLAALRSTRGGGIDVGGQLSLPLGTREAVALSYAAVYHPWLVRRDSDGALRSVPPDGALTGTLAHRSLVRGAWVAPANEALSETLALEPPIDPANWPSLQEAQLNFLRQDAWGFRCLAADTLAIDTEIRPINVRRLLQLLRRLALRQGATYTFEPLSDAFQRAVHHSLEALLLQLFARGAFAGRKPSDAFQIQTGPDVNPPASLELGRFIVEIRVAPSMPLRFLTLRLSQTGDRVEVTESR